MARPLRIQFPGACYHVMSRGNARQDIFFSNGDRRTFLKTLGYSAELHDVMILCYVPMPNHFHLVLKTHKANLGD